MAVARSAAWAVPVPLSAEYRTVTTAVPTRTASRVVPPAHWGLSSVKVSASPPSAGLDGLLPAD